MLTVRWTTLGPPITPRVAPVRGVGTVRITAEDIERFGPTALAEDPEVILERVLDDPEARYRVGGLAPPEPVVKVPEPAPRAAAQSAKPKRGGKRGWLASLFGK